MGVCLRFVLCLGPRPVSLSEAVDPLPPSLAAVRIFRTAARGRRTCWADLPRGRTPARRAVRTAAPPPAARVPPQPERIAVRLAGLGASASEHERPAAEPG